MKAHKVLFLLATCAGLVLAPLSIPAATLYVATTGDDANDGLSEANAVRTIQHAYNIAGDGDTVMVADGTYNECVLAGTAAPNQRSIHLQGSGPNTVVDGLSGTGVGCTPLSPVILLGGFDSSIDGFTITGGHWTGLVTGGTVAVTNNTIEGNTGPAGGGILAYSGVCYYGSSTTTISNNIIRNNDAIFEESVEQDKTGRGGGILIIAEALTAAGGGCGDLGDGGSATVITQGNTIEDNTAELDGGGIYAFTNTTDPALPANVTITQNTITGNLAGIIGAAGLPGFGGGVFVTTFGYYSENITVSANPVIADNRATGLGGGIAAQIDSLGFADHDLLVNDNNLTNNQADEDGGGMNLFLYAQQLDPTEHLNLSVSGNSIVGNTALGAAAGGGGLLATLQPILTNAPDITLAVEDNRITDNHADFAGGGASLFISAEADDASINPQTGATGPARGELLFKNNIVARNESTGGVDPGLSPVGGGILAFLLAAGDAIATLDLQLNTIVDNTTEIGAGGIEVENFTEFDIYGNPEEGLVVVKLQNSIVANNNSFGFGGPPAAFSAGTFNIDVVDLLYNDFYGNGQNYEDWVQDRTGQDGNISADPMLGPFPNYIPMTCSPTIDSGDPTLAVGDEPAPNGDVINMGHTGGKVTAANSLADPSGDGFVDGIDILRIATAFGSMPLDLRWDESADIDSNGLVDGDDLDFITLLQFGAACPQ